MRWPLVTVLVSERERPDHLRQRPTVGLRVSVVAQSNEALAGVSGHLNREARGLAVLGRCQTAETGELAEVADCRGLGSGSGRSKPTSAVIATARSRRALPSSALEDGAWMCGCMGGMRSPGVGSHAGAGGEFRGVDGAKPVREFPREI